VTTAGQSVVPETHTHNNTHVHALSTEMKITKWQTVRKTSWNLSARVTKQHTPIDHKYKQKKDSKN